MYVRIFSPYAGLCLNQVLHHHGIKNSRGREPLFYKIPMSSSHPHALGHISSVQFSSVAQLCLTLCNTMDCSMPGFPVHHQLLEFIPKLMSIESVMPSYHLILCRPLLLRSHGYLKYEYSGLFWAYYCLYSYFSSIIWLHFGKKYSLKCTIPVFDSLKVKVKSLSLVRLFATA